MLRASAAVFSNYLTLHSFCTCVYGLKSSQRSRLCNLALLAAIPTMASFRVDEGGQDGSINFDEAVGQVNGMKLQGPERRSLRSDRTTGEVTIGDLPVGSFNCKYQKTHRVLLFLMVFNCKHQKSMGFLLF